MTRPGSRSPLANGMLGPLCTLCAYVVGGLLATGVAQAEHFAPNPPPKGLAPMDLYALTVLNKAQVLSFSVGTEICGTIGVNDDGVLVHSSFTRGGPGTCTIPPAPGMRSVASFHTHGVPAPLSDGEIPSDTDLESDFANDEFGYVATPGGRFWKVRPEYQDTVLLCHGCVLTHREYAPCGQKIKARYTLRTLKRRFGVAYAPCP